MAAKNKVWRFQRSRPDGEVVTAMTHDRQFVLHFPMDQRWDVNFNSRFTFYAVAAVAGSIAKPHLRVLREVTEGEWK